ncbi:hypothetical protein NE237_019365 [Protea cynaroides]|uniref:Uncharacterized protein n=1 Tax=Protea cynaroides TaxID=273540 RepID=A0A9Q0KBW4_9MAGN|nr:hypothetical protein NE237_019365 [Protea cynaroides]
MLRKNLDLSQPSALVEERMRQDQGAKDKEIKSSEKDGFEDSSDSSDSKDGSKEGSEEASKHGPKYGPKKDANVRSSGVATTSTSSTPVAIRTRTPISKLRPPSHIEFNDEDFTRATSLANVRVDAEESDSTITKMKIAETLFLAARFCEMSTSLKACRTPSSRRSYYATTLRYKALKDNVESIVKVHNEVIKEYESQMESVKKMSTELKGTRATSDMLEEVRKALEKEKKSAGEVTSSTNKAKEAIKKTE